MTNERQPSKPVRALAILGLCAVLCVALFVPSTANAGDGAFVTGRGLAALCSSTKAEDTFSCQSYIAGIIDYHRLIRSLGTAPSVDFCVPDKATMAQLKTLVTAYIKQHTEHQDFIASPAVAMALFNAYPCPSAVKSTRKRHW